MMWSCTYNPRHQQPPAPQTTGASPESGPLGESDAARRQYEDSLFGKLTANEADGGPKIYWGRRILDDQVPEGVKELLPTVEGIKAKVNIVKR